MLLLLLLLPLLLLAEAALLLLLLAARLLLLLCLPCLVILLSALSLSASAEKVLQVTRQMAYPRLKFAARELFYRTIRLIVQFCFALAPR